MTVKGMDGQTYNVTSQGQGNFNTPDLLPASLRCWASTSEGLAQECATRPLRL